MCTYSYFLNENLANAFFACIIQCICLFCHEVDYNINKVYFLKSNFRLRFLYIHTFVAGDGIIVQYGNTVSISCVTLYAY